MRSDHQCFDWQAAPLHGWLPTHLCAALAAASSAWSANAKTKMSTSGEREKTGVCSSVRPGKQWRTRIYTQRNSRKSETFFCVWDITWARNSNHSRRLVRHLGYLGVVSYCRSDEKCQAAATLYHGVSRWAYERLTRRTIDWLSRLCQLNGCQSTDWHEYPVHVSRVMKKICASLPLYNNTRCL